MSNSKIKSTVSFVIDGLVVISLIMVMVCSYKAFANDADFMHGDGRPLKEILEEKDARIRKLQARLSLLIKLKQESAFRDGCEAGYWMRSEIMISNILNDNRLTEETKSAYHHSPKPSCYDKWSYIIESYDYGQNK